ncbi:hypothetical protein ES332_A10G282900v1 [Gossypium tomentosum]|uniref:Uncharacterized protein n=1 Tax=Gossypium tomentosum TaxID=34277 RepID=A0A5D2NXC7_GOSTO|nr:hypothetical protein ES332_A10G282900v1 [Gossypium tomentosum]
MHAPPSQFPINTLSIHFNFPSLSILPNQKRVKFSLKTNMPSSSSTFPVTLVSKTMIFPDQKSNLGELKLSVSDLPMLSCHYIQKGCLFTRPSIPINSLISILKQALSKTLSFFSPLAGRLYTDRNGYIYITCNDAGVEFHHAKVSYQGHYMPIMAVQLTELADGVFIGCSVNHAVTDDFTREPVLISPAVLRLPEGGPKVTFNENEPLRERIFSFSKEAIMELNAKANNFQLNAGDFNAAGELMGKQSNDKYKPIPEISSFQSLSALLWRAVTRGRKLPASQTTTFRMAVNCRHRLNPKLNPLYFGNAIQSIPTDASAGDVTSRDLRWCAQRLNENVKAHDDETVRRFIKEWEKDPRCFPFGNFDGASMTMGSSPRFPMYDNDFGWGRPLAVRSGGANKFDGKISAFPGREGNGSVDLEVVLGPETMAAIESDGEFIRYVSN